MAAQLDARLVMARIAAMKQLRSMLPSDAAVRGVVAAIAEPFYAAAENHSSSVDAQLLKALTAAVHSVSSSATQPSSPLKARLVALTPPQPCVSVNAGADAVARRRSQTPPAAPFAVDALIVARAGPYAGHPLAFRLVFNAPYLSSPPKIRCRTYALSWLFTGVALSDRGDPVAMRRCGVEFYKFLLKKSSSPFELGTVLTALADALEPGAHPFFAMSAAVHAGRLGVIDKFASLGLAKLLPSTAQTAFRADGLRAALESGALPRGALPPALVAALLEAEQLRAAGSDSSAKTPLRELCEPLDAELFAVDLFEESFAAALLADVDAFEATGLPVSRPNSMNKYGVVVNDVGFEHLITTLQRFVLQPLASALYGGRAGGDPAADFDAHHSFVVRYDAAGGDKHLAPHTDDSDVTFNCCLGRRGFEGSGLVFCGELGRPDHRKHSHTFAHRIGGCVVHLGSRRHGSDTIVSGERCNLIVWCRSLAWRDSRRGAEAWVGASPGQENTASDGSRAPRGIFTRSVQSSPAFVASTRVAFAPAETLSVLSVWARSTSWTLDSLRFASWKTTSQSAT
ncbi:hypothetical protein AURANDRAFT_66003 [Aureococcus anophagefferens]|uniref:Fe2OG dioxygenase domain-containing protein n=1 Tax=Aureococcus anophagefferens TaxID=44056 RepID=F0YG00_AURAN|nr:hypothetical protein AURANDRAFT_66003 [Aureococcus anophagefferens]EGB06020.1 hypothetical protein AURANDRAFT_66003 [Aureococcus anophagefferens]|eukprot:XP_009039277.1 hypothetical protein AURANDRAFT_66003 [Aureococcus anophagefferens]